MAPVQTIIKIKIRFRNMRLMADKYMKQSPEWKQSSRGKLEVQCEHWQSTSLTCSSRGLGWAPLLKYTDGCFQKTHHLAAKALGCFRRTRGQKGMWNGLLNSGTKGCKAEGRSFSGAAQHYSVPGSVPDSKSPQQMGHSVSPLRKQTQKVNKWIDKQYRQTSNIDGQMLSHLNISPQKFKTCH